MNAVAHLRVWIGNILRVQSPVNWFLLAGFYSLADEFPVFHLQCITMRKKPVYLTTVVGIPPQEDYYLGKASERIFLPVIRKTLPEIVDMHFPAEGIFHNIVLVSIDKRYPGHARKIMNAFWGLGQLMFSKTIIVVDKNVNVQDVSEVAWIAGTHIDPQRDILFTRGPMDDLENDNPFLLDYIDNAVVADS